MQNDEASDDSEEIFTIKKRKNEGKTKNLKFKKVKKNSLAAENKDHGNNVIAVPRRNNSVKKIAEFMFSVDGNDELEVSSIKTKKDAPISTGLSSGSGITALKLELLAQKERKEELRHTNGFKQPLERAFFLQNGDNVDKEEDLKMDRDWYAGDDLEAPCIDDETHNPFGSENMGYDETREARWKLNKLRGKNNGKMNSYSRMKNTLRNEASDLWENNRMMSSGAIRNLNNFNDDLVSSDLNEENPELDISVNFRIPKFLQEDINELNSAKNIPDISKNTNSSILSNFLTGSLSAVSNQNMISPFKDPESDMAVYAKKGSFLVKENMQKSEKKKQARDTIESSKQDSKLGTLLNEKDSDKNESDEEYGADKRLKKLNKFIDSMKDNESKENQEGNSSSFVKNLTIEQQRKALPVYTVRDEFLRVVDENQVIIVVGETGSGKTTQLTQYLYEHGYGKHGMMIGCTQPRRIAAMSVAKRVSEEMECKVGTTVGFSIRFEDVTSEDTIIRYMTDGILLKETLTDTNLMKYSCIIIDEAHERTLNTDILLALFKRILARRLDLKIIITSATMNAAKFSRYFGNAPMFNIPGRTFPVEIFYSRVTPSDYVENCVKTCLTIHLTYSADDGDILVFLTGKSDIDACCEVLADKLEELKKDNKDGNISDYLILPIYSQMPADLQSKVFDKAEKGTRKIIFATNIAETSLTIDNIKYVVDCGYYKLKMFNPKIGMDTLQVVPISVANAMQRSGRAGRTAPGNCYRLYSNSAFENELFQETIPEIQRTNLSMTLLLLKSLNINDFKKFQFLDMPSSLSIYQSLYDLWSIGAINEKNGLLTELGKKMLKFPMDPTLSKVLINSVDMNCTMEIIIIVSMLSVPSIFYRPKERQAESDSMREKFAVAESDHLTLLNVYLQWEKSKFSNKWCTKHFINHKSLLRAKEIQDQLILIFENNFFKGSNNFLDKNAYKINNWENIRKCLCSGFSNQASKFKSLGKYTNLKTGLELNLHPTSSLYGLSDLPKFVIYHELIFTNKEYMNYVTEVDPKWLVEYGEALYTLKETKTKFFESV